YRCLHDANDLTRDQALVDAAQVWANHLATNVCSGKVYDTGDFGENIYLCTSSTGDNADPCVDAQYIIPNWYDEVTIYNQGDEFSEWTKQFTQMVWKATTSLGCARSQYCEGQGSYNGYNVMFAVCRYSPKGNIAGQFNDQVLA
ncbi:unnamed protein product, partial [Choristocarpus tenellus]